MGGAFAMFPLHKGADGFMSQDQFEKFYWPTLKAFMEGLNEAGLVQQIKMIHDRHPVLNYGFDITPARLVEGLITERGICQATEDSIMKLFPDKG